MTYKKSKLELHIIKISTHNKNLLDIKTSIFKFGIGIYFSWLFFAKGDYLVVKIVTLFTLFTSNLFHFEKFQNFSTYFKISVYDFIETVVKYYQNGCIKTPQIETLKNKFNPYSFENILLFSGHWEVKCKRKNVKDLTFMNIS
jgi:hypothetical protein